MQFESQILRFQQGSRSSHPAPDATIASLQSGTLSQRGEQLAVLVDLTPLLPYRSREIRTLAVKTYWASSGSIVARLRRALAAANRYLVRLNEQATASAKCTGSITCAVFAQDELFLGQIGAAHTYVLHAPNPDFPASNRRFEVYPERNRLMISLGNALPPEIHIGYTQLEVGTTVLLASTSVAESQARELWQQSMSMSAWNSVINTISRSIESNHASGTVIVSRVLADPQPGTALQSDTRHKSRRRSNSRNTNAPTPARDIAEAQVEPPASAFSRSVESHGEPVPARLLPRAGTGHVDSVQRASLPPELITAVDDTRNALPQKPAEDRIIPEPPGPPVKITRVQHIDPETGEVLEMPEPTPSRPRRSIDVGIVGRWLKIFFAEMKREQPERVRASKSGGERQQLRMALRSLLPQQDTSPANPSLQRKPPKENKPLLPALVIGISVVILLITVSMFAQLGGADKAAELEQALVETRDKAYNEPDQQNWKLVSQQAERILQLDEGNARAAQILEEAENALLALEYAAILNATQLYELPVTSGLRKLLLAQDQLFILDTSTDEVVSFQLTADRQALASTVPVPVLRRGQMVEDTMVENILDIAWVPPVSVGDFGVVYMLGENGTLYIYAPSIGSGNVVNTIGIQHLSGELSPGNVTAMDTYGNRIFIVQRVNNQIMTFNPINGTYDLSHSYFSANATPDLRLVFDIAIDQRVYLLMGDGKLLAYYDGVADYTFDYEGVPNQTFNAQIFAVESDPNDGYIYLGDPQTERIAMFDKRGHFLHLFRASGNQFQRLEALAIAEEQDVLYFVAANRLYAALLPEFAR